MVVVAVGGRRRVGFVVQARRAALGAARSRVLALEERLVQRVGLHVARVCRPQLLVAGGRGRAVAALRLALCNTRSLVAATGHGARRAALPLQSPAARAPATLRCVRSTERSQRTVTALLYHGSPVEA